MTAPLKPLAVSLGDPAGIGPELIVEAWAQRDSAGLKPFFVIGGKAVIEAAARTRGIALSVTAIDDPDQAGGVFADALPVLGAFDSPYTPGTPDAAGAQLALASLERGAEIARLGLASGLVTAPVAKSALVAVGFQHPGQTEYLAAACGRPEHDAVMMLAGPSLRAVPLTVHCALGDVPALLTADLIKHKARIVAEALRRDFGIAAPRLAVAGLNPHAGEGGQFGSEEAAIIAPAIAALRSEGLDVVGPIPGDALFTPRMRETYDAALAMYHDQALIPLKALDFDAGVNVTLGLPIVRTSPDHGTAFDIAGKNIADPGAMIAALRMAGECAAGRASHD
ncbi:4-hydroxythreonine-4-phosphate dehydrogenase PdxA [Qipengyuania marisflavi]|uniref:4-hydroxythreonine-4-phosphate dehydrogenase n=1 Tax=Qipengyuania marisflavi TaxID=2486356 RepID=A0A5S3Q1Y1_9SPHN|nr:4-hydroxythreonine-4-phosphate dehydrogenase PdxA [Qipengyuania marisflavi]TMM50377.1 4-hydroxythreonine-4-phosphate dehydrogenase PdxA [Qipengyuania marisflavi]